MIKRIAIMGCGSLGTILGAYLNRAGLDVTMVDAWKEHVQALRDKGAKVVGGVEMTVPVKCAVTPEEMEGTFDLFIYMAKQTFNDVAIPQMVEHCHKDTIICTCQNGIPELNVAKYWPEDNIMGCTVGYPATLLGPGVSQLTTTEDGANFEFHIGRLNGKVDELLREVAGVFDNMCRNRSHITENLMADRWSKILINATFSGMSTVSADTFGYTLNNEQCSKYVARIGRECVRVCHAMGIRLPLIFGLDYNELYDYNDEIKERQSINKIISVMGSDQPGKASMLQDLEKGRKCEIRFINGALSEAGDKMGIDTPYCDAVVDIVSRVENGELPLANHCDLMPDLPVKIV